MDLGKATLETFEPCVGDAFALSAGDASAEIVLHSALALGEWPGGRQPFSLTFRGPAEPALPQATYGFEHAELGAFDLFIVPIGRDDGGMIYEAVIT